MEEGLHLAYSFLDPSDFIHGWHPGNVGIHPEFGDRGPCALPVAAVTNYLTLMSLNKINVFAHSSGVQSLKSVSQG